MVNAYLRIIVLLAAVGMLPVSSMTQSVGCNSNVGLSLPDTAMGNIKRYNVVQKHWLVAGKVTTLRGDPVAGAEVDVVPAGASGEFRTLVTDFQGVFQTEYCFNAEIVKEFAVDLKVTKKGFLKAHAVIDFGSSEKPWVIPVTLREPEEDSELLSQADLISGLAPRMKKLGVSEGLSAAAEKDYAHAVAEFLDRNRSDQALPFFTEVTRRDASCLPCRTMLALAELDSGDWDGAYRNLAEVFNKILADRSLGRPEPFVALGVMESWRHQPRNAAGYFVEALKFAPRDPLALQELGRSQLLIQNWEAADEYLAKAIAAGAAPEVRLLRVQALLGADQFQAADTEMARYLDGRDLKKMPFQVRQLWAQIENRKKIEAVYGKAKPNDDRAIEYLRRRPPDLTGLEPATDQGQLDSILSAVGKTVTEFFGNLPNTSSLEEIHQETLRRKQKVGATLDQKFRYLCFTPAEAWGPGFDEYRADLSGGQAWPRGLGDGFMLTSGFASASLLFHPMYQPQAAFRYVGRQKVGGRDTYVVAFAQQPSKARLNGTFRSGEISMTIFSRGLAWIDSQTYQITRLRTDLLKPLLEIKLENVTTEIAYGEVHFKGMAVGFWVPQQVTVAVDWNGRHFRNEHRYSEFKLFKVEAFEKVGKRKELGQASKPASDSH
jgi:tetratricopeptide (TPR) repeat protein